MIHSQALTQFVLTTGACSDSFMIILFFLKKERESKIMFLYLAILYKPSKTTTKLEYFTPTINDLILNIKTAPTVTCFFPSAGLTT